MTQRLRNGSRPWWLLFVISGVLITIVYFVLTPWNTSHLSSHPRPAQSYNEALHLVEIFQEKERQKMNPVCRMQLMTHNKKTERAIILVHGYSSCPQQFHELGQRFYDSGYNVLIAPLPHHGLADRMTNAHSQLTAEELAAYADQAVDIARGLGGKVFMMGLSAGGVTTAWAAQNRNDIDLAVIISPAFGFKKIPAPLTAAAMNFYTILPDALEWWDHLLKEKAPPEHSYALYSRHALVEILRLGFATLNDARHHPPAAKKIIMVLNANDIMVNNDETNNIINVWKADNANLTTYEFRADLKLGHDLIDPSQPDQRTEIVYPRLMGLIDHR